MGGERSRRVGDWIRVTPRRTASERAERDRHGAGGAISTKQNACLCWVVNKASCLSALDKTLLLRGVEYNDIRIEPDKKRIGLIAQEVELIIPEVVGIDEATTIKNIEYGSLVGLLIE